MNQEEQAIADILAGSSVIAVVGMSSKTSRASYGVAQYMQRQGYRIVPVNPTYAGTHILGELCCASLTDAAAAVEAAGSKIDIVDCFRRSDQVAPVIDEAIAIGARCVWMQLGVIDKAAADKARNAGLLAVVDKCIKIEHMQLR